MGDSCDGPCARVMAIHAESKAATAVLASRVDGIDKVLEGVISDLKDGATAFTEATQESAKASMHRAAEYEKMSERLKTGSNRFDMIENTQSKNQLFNFKWLRILSLLVIPGVIAFLLIGFHTGILTSVKTSIGPVSVELTESSNDKDNE